MEPLKWQSAVSIRGNFLVALYFQIVMLFHSKVLPCESNLCTQIRFTRKHLALKKDAYFGKKG